MRSLNGISSDDWPSHSEELARKSMTTLEAWLKDYHAGLISTDEMRRFAGALYDVTSGLIPHEEMELIADIHKELSRGV